MFYYVAILAQGSSAVLSALQSRDFRFARPSHPFLNHAAG